MSRFSSEIEQLLQAGGWYEGRSVPALVESWQKELERGDGFKLSQVARQVLDEFGGLHIMSEGAGVACARSDLDLNPSLAKFEEDRFFSFDCLKGKGVFPLGEAILGHVFAAIDDAGNVYLVMQEVHHVASSFEAALENLLLGLGTKFLEKAAA
ncbi:MAG: SUKH-3 domain-containing protein [Pyrinomonadaceae bacterium]